MKTDSTKSLYAGLKTKAPPCYDSSRKPGADTINKEATRGGMVPKIPSLGPRSA